MLRKPLPPYTLQTPEGEKRFLPDLKGQVLVLVRNPGLAEGLWARGEELKALEAQAFLLAASPVASPLPLLLDPTGALLAAIPEEGALVADAFHEVYHLGPVEDLEELLAWVRLALYQCPECVAPEGDWV